MAELKNQPKISETVPADTFKMNHKLEGKIFKTGEKGPVGKYICANCIGSPNDFLEISNPDTPMPECPKCGPASWYKIEID